MQFSYATDSAAVKADVLIVPVFEESNPFAGYRYGAKLRKLFPAGDLEGKAGQSLLLPAGGAVAATRVLLLGLGKRADASAQGLGEALAGFFRGGAVDSYRLTHVALALEVFSGRKQVQEEALGSWIAEGALLGSYQFDRLITRKEKRKICPTRITLAGGSDAELRKGVNAGRITAEYTAYARDLVNEPSNRLNPATLAKFAQDMARRVPGLHCRVIKKPELQRLKMGALLAVNAGSDIPANLIVLEWQGGPKSQRPIAFVGKGLCFDSGGYDIKPAAGMLNMKIDMGGGAATIAALGGAAARRLKTNLVGVVPATENLINGSAFHPGSVVTSMSGKTIEIGNTDAEGRLILCDALTFVQKSYRPRAIVDMATLTGAQIVALGSKVVALMSNDDELARSLESAFDAVGESVWRLPLPEFYQKQLETPIADLKNIGGNPGTITAALFLQRFIDEGRKWAHLDIAGPVINDAEGWRLWSGRSATGSPVRSLIEFARAYSG